MNFHLNSCIRYPYVIPIWTSKTLVLFSCLYVHYFEALINLIALNTFYMFMISIFFLFSFLLNADSYVQETIWHPIWVFIKQLKLNVPNYVSYLSLHPHSPASLPTFHVSVNGTSILPAAKTKNLEIIFDSFLSFRNLYLI